MESKPKVEQGGIKKYNLSLIFLLAVAFVLRFWGLGYSHFYGDETKTFYLDKTLPAARFFLTQRKGPVQFTVVWVMEKFIGGFDEFWTRLPFAIAGVLTIVVFYILLAKILGKRVAVISSILFGLNGFNIAFSRTIQYQSFLLLFGLLAILFAFMYLHEERKKRFVYAFSSAVFLALAYLSHYDAIFFTFPAAFLFIHKLLKEKRIGNLVPTLKEISLYFVLPFVLFTSPFFIPYLKGGYYEQYTQNYVGRRLLGDSFDQNHSGYTFWVYNPSFVWVGLLVFLLPYFFRKAEWEYQMVMLWFLTGLITFELVFSNPGTHINNYFIPLLILIGIGIDIVYKWLQSRGVKLLFSAFLTGCFLWIGYIDFTVFVPEINRGYPWKDTKIGYHSRPKVNKAFHLFLYGFPYNRGWDEISKYFEGLEGVRGVYTNDNDTLAQYYLYGLDYTPPGPNYLPQYYVYVFNNQEFDDIDPFDLSLYEKQKEFFVDGGLTSIVYKLIK